MVSPLKCKKKSVDIIYVCLVLKNKFRSLYHFKGVNHLNQDIAAHNELPPPNLPFF